ncbi:sorting nexin 2B-like [Phragmites australis]|uniref:sorting nexin 2B-like n=1 Tax=Phragmites australis TaxID=29695 RepID=UPI002D7839AD|nr:sorting nexin 2B-like [Phragmites australis]XP_062208611.1 sorting nexin 2B-like [Phragmites australis]
MSPLVDHSTRYASVYATHVDLSLAAAACVVFSALAVCVGMDMMIMFTAGRGLHHAQLNRRLADTFWVHFVPPWPGKNTIESQVMQRDEFVAQLHVALERYLWRLAEHPAIGPSDELHVFLQAEGKMPLSGSTDVASRMLDGPARLPRQLPSGEEDVVQPAKGGRDLLRIFKELKQSVVIDWVDVKPPLVEEERGVPGEEGEAAGVGAATHQHITTGCLTLASSCPLHKGTNRNTCQGSARYG